MYSRENGKREKIVIFLIPCVCIISPNSSLMNYFISVALHIIDTIKLHSAIQEKKVKINWSLEKDLRKN